jgi:hypothetical protein
MQLLSGELPQPIEISIDGEKKTITHLGFNLRKGIIDLPAEVLEQAQSNPDLAKHILLTHSVARMIMEGKLVQGGLEQEIGDGEQPDSLRFLRELEHTNVYDPMPRDNDIFPVSVNPHRRRKGLDSAVSILSDAPDKLFPLHLGLTRDYTEESYFNLLDTAQLFAGAQFIEVVDKGTENERTVLLDIHSFETTSGQDLLKKAGLVGTRQINAYETARKNLGHEPDFAEFLDAQQANISADITKAKAELKEKMAGSLAKADFGKDPDLKMVVAAIAGFAALVSSGLNDIFDAHEKIEIVGGGKLW